MEVYSVYDDRSEEKESQGRSNTTNPIQLRVVIFANKSFTKEHSAIKQRRNAFLTCHEGLGESEEGGRTFRTWA